MDRKSAVAGLALVSVVAMLSAAPAGAQDGMYSPTAPIAPADPQYVCALNPGLCTPPPCSIGAAMTKKFSIGKFTAKRSGKGLLKVKVSCPGEIVVADSSKKLIKRATRKVASGGTFTLTLNPSGAGRSRLKTRRSANVRVTVAFKPAVGGVSDHKKNIKFKLPAKKK